MEPFGLFQFLQNLLSSQQTSAPAASSDTPSNTTAYQEEKVSACPPNQVEKTSPQNEAVLQFFSAHDERVKRTRQKR